MSPNTIRRFLRAEACPQRAAGAPRHSRLSPFEPYLRARWDAGVQNGRRLLTEIRARGYRGSGSNRYTLLALWRPGPRRPGPYPRQPRVTPAPPPPLRAAPWGGCSCMRRTIAHGMRRCLSTSSSAAARPWPPGAAPSGAFSPCSVSGRWMVWRPGCRRRAPAGSLNWQPSPRESGGICRPSARRSPPRGATSTLHTAPRHSDGDRSMVVVEGGMAKRQVPRSL